MTTQTSGRHAPRVFSSPGGPAGPPTGGRRAPSPQPAPRRFGRVFKVAGFTILPVLLLVLLAVGIGYVRLLHGPISLKAFSEQIEERINADLNGFTVHIDDALITLADDFRVELRLTNLRIKEDDGDLVASAPSAALELNRTAFWRFEVSPKRVDLIEPRLAVTYSSEHGISLSINNAPPIAIETANSGEEESAIVPPAPVAAERPLPSFAQDGSSPAFHRVDLARLLAESSARARRGEAATSRLKAFGIRNARVSVTCDDVTSEVFVPEASFDVDHTKRDSVISGAATVESAKGPWSLKFRTEDSEQHDLVKVAATVENLVPSTLAPISADLALLSMFDTPVNGVLNLDLSNAGDLRSADLSIDVADGFIRLPAVSSTPFMLDKGKIALKYNAETRRLDLMPSTLDWDGSHITLHGAMQNDPEETGQPQWHFALRSIDGSISAKDFGVAPIPVESLEAMGRIIPGEDLVQLSGLALSVGGGVVNVNGDIIGGPDAPSTRVEATVSPMPIETLKAMWPRAVAPAARDWMGAQVERANLKSASFKLLSGRFIESEGSTSNDAGAREPERLSAHLELGDIRMVPLPNSLPIEAENAAIRLENSALEVSVPEARIIVDETRRMPLSDVRLTAVDVTHDAPLAELALTSETSLEDLIETLNRSELNLTGQGPLPIAGVDGKVEGEIKIAMPLIADAKVSKIEGNARISDIRGRNEDYQLTIQGGTVDIEVSDIGVIAKGDLSVNGVMARLHMHRILDAPSHLQPPIRISSTLDNADRRQLGLDVNHLVQGEIAAEVTVSHTEAGENAVHVQVDLTNAELIIEELAWRKLPGRQANAQFDLDVAGPNRTELNNFKVVGDMIALDGWIVANEKRDLVEYAFPNFSLNVVSRLDVRGKVDKNKIWKVTAKGSTFDAKDLFRSLLALGKTVDHTIAPAEPAVGVDLTAQVDTVLGHSDVSLRNYSVKLSQRNGQIVSLDGRGTLDGGEPFAVVMTSDGPRRFYAESTDAGQTFKLVGFYPNIQGGRMRLEVDLEARGDAEKSGTLWVEDFRVLGDPIVSEVYSSIDGSSGGRSEGRQRKGEREVFEFQLLRVPFSVGHGQFVLGDSQIRGPLLGASIRGRVDYNTQRLNLGGTYVPLQGINSAFCDIPLFGPIVSGLDCQGVFGITYAIQGPMARPQVLVNPLSMLTPGIFRGIMEMTSPNPQVQPLREQKTKGPASSRVRASSSAPASTVDGWSSETTLPSDRKKR
ncbi:hypothetical protein W911_15205 [Hyphomicrobium nitrativorans NL23]|uniref:AsmA-like C-terminal domain-containing protein n=1 Tax=Hyphomicrobium nitrativorans NL23 TaxID=1029756 RepID=V5SEZ3_9HYPH|nr:hypothetical protein W911_15205 [Hyphomicrobium nitrativorans NL23]